MKQRRALVALATLLLVGLLVLVVLLQRDDDLDPQPAAPAAPEAVSSPSAAPPLPIPSVLVPAANAPVDQITPTAPAGAPPITLPPDTQPLVAEFVPGTTEWEEVPLLEDGAQIIRFLPKRYNVIVPAPIVLLLEVVDTATKKRIVLASPRARVRPFDREDDWVEIPMVDDGTHRYVATLTPSAAQRQRLLGRVFAEAIVQTPEAGTRRIPQALIYTVGPRAHLTGKWRDERRDGHLYLSAEIEVDEPGLFTLMAQLVGPSRQPIALTRTMAQLSRGSQWLTMRVWGKAIRDAAVDGPYEVRNVLLTRDLNEKGDYDPGPTIVSAHVTHGYRAAEFSADSYVEPPVTPQGEVIGPGHPSQAANPPPQYQDSERPSRSSTK